MKWWEIVFEYNVCKVLKLWQFFGKRETILHNLSFFSLFSFLYDTTATKPENSYKPYFSLC